MGEHAKQGRLEMGIEEKEVQEEVIEGSDEQTSDKDSMAENSEHSLLGKEVSEQEEGKETEEGKEEGVDEGKDKPASLPEKYEVKIEGMEINEDLLSALTPTFKKYNLTKDAVQELANVYAPIIKSQQDAMQKKIMDDYKAEIEGWKAKSIEILGANSTKELSYAAKFIDKFGGKELRQFLNDTGLGNHPEMVKTFIKAGKTISEDAFVDGSTNQTNGKRDLYTHPSSQKSLR